jgi:hypothetical protein
MLLHHAVIFTDEAMWMERRVVEVLRRALEDIDMCRKPSQSGCSLLIANSDPLRSTGLAAAAEN